jgi:hypothetical protein
LIRFRRCPFCWGETTEEHATVGGGIYRYRLCARCCGMYAFENITPERPTDEEAAAIPF